MIPFPTLAFSFAIERHRGQFRKDGKTPYIKHIKDVYEMVSNYGEDAGIIACLHDLLKDTDTTYIELEVIFGEEIAELVKVLSYDKEKFPVKKDWIEWLGSVEDEDVLIVKLADRICNSRDFLKSGDKRYALKYLMQAETIYKNVVPLGFYDLIKAYDHLRSELEKE